MSFYTFNTRPVGLFGWLVAFLPNVVQIFAPQIVAGTAHAVAHLPVPVALGITTLIGSTLAWLGRAPTVKPDAGSGVLNP